MSIGKRVNIWIVGEGPVTYRGQTVTTTGDSRPVAMRVVAEDGRLSPTVLRMGQFVVIHDQTPPEWEQA